MFKNRASLSAVSVTACLAGYLVFASPASAVDRGDLIAQLERSVDGLDYIDRNHESISIELTKLNSLVRMQPATVSTRDAAPSRQLLSYVSQRLSELSTTVEQLGVFLDEVTRLLNEGMIIVETQRDDQLVGAYADALKRAGTTATVHDQLTKSIRDLQSYIAGFTDKNPKSYRRTVG